MISPLIYYSYNILINHNILSLLKLPCQVALEKATQKDHAQPGQVHTKYSYGLRHYSNSLPIG